MKNNFIFIQFLHLEYFTCTRYTYMYVVYVRTVLFMLLHVHAHSVCTCVTVPDNRNIFGAQKKFWLLSKYLLCFSELLLFYYHISSGEEFTDKNWTEFGANYPQMSRRLAGARSPRVSVSGSRREEWRSSEKTWNKGNEQFGRKHAVGKDKQTHEQPWMQHCRGGANGGTERNLAH